VVTGWRYGPPVLAACQQSIDHIIVVNGKNKEVFAFFLTRLRIKVIAAV
jgi:hypothetical protein